ncbi:mannosyl-3-phosphoglycerate phosphatase-related protein YedP [Prochlorococcus marinus]|uniref:Mannosyl-3-phosphoglycerate phosphatase-related protein n=1 Tax=Prochlorococcus marinus XMU1408 TaxID=2213228 RepID=A0A318RAV7_PROMR|nr:mannosyl-3-phosphoglycerate phosphatase-related protein YedP [Prochlorococcus marinus]MBW3041876.1 mannosyl-3-phosphoglycerate phosphatase-related protein [Prochlorococcus marinus str. XMU1408]PYE03009.1 mannosyl-3-phosphoglycerate phosphatase-related protein [Prochlorococcus marinus XMU1408]
MSNNSKLWIVTDLDGTLMDENYDISPARNTLNLLRELAIPVIPCTSKTASEVRFFRNENRLLDPFIVENGAAVYGCHENNTSEWELLLGKSYKELRIILMNISEKVNYHLTPLNDLNNNQIFELTGLSDQGIKRALDRQWSVPFLNPPDEIFEKVKLICESYDVHVFKGNRMSHLLSNESHKGKAVNKLKLYLNNKDVKVVALGDSQNDLPLLEYADISIVVPGINGPNKYLQNGIDKGSFRLANAPHAQGWSNSVEDIINNINDL